MKFYKIKGDCFHILVFQKKGKTYFELNKLDTLVLFIQLKFWRIAKKNAEVQFMPFDKWVWAQLAQHGKKQAGSKKKAYSIW